MKKRVAVLISGNGSNLQAILDAGATKYKNDYQVVGVLSNKHNAYGLQRAQKAGVATKVISHKNFSSREEFDQAIDAWLRAQQVDLIVLAGFMRRLSAGFVDAWYGRMINIHPSLLPKYPGLNTHQQVLQAGDNQHGATVHFVSSDLDMGPRIAYASCEVFAADTPEILQNRVLRLEHVLYPLVVSWCATEVCRLGHAGVQLAGKYISRHGVDSLCFSVA